MSAKYYAVKNGKVPGIYRSWEECKAQVDGFSCASYKSFKTEQEAMEFMGNNSVSDNENDSENTYETCAYVDGSYNVTTGEFSYGMIVLQDGKEYEFCEKMDNPELASMRNVAGEIKGAEAAMKYALDNRLDSIVIYHDYEGIAKWCTGEWKANKEGTIAYKNFYEEASKQVNIRFVKVTGHSGDRYNDIADLLAKKALGIA